MSQELNDFYAFLIGKKFIYAKSMVFALQLRAIIKDNQPIPVDNTYKENRLNVELDGENTIINILSVG